MGLLFKIILNAFLNRDRPTRDHIDTKKREDSELDGEALYERAQSAGILLKLQEFDNVLVGSKHVFEIDYYESIAHEDTAKLGFVEIVLDEETKLGICVVYLHLVTWVNNEGKTERLYSSLMYDNKENVMKNIQAFAESCIETFKIGCKTRVNLDIANINVTQSVEPSTKWTSAIIDKLKSVMGPVDVIDMLQNYHEWQLSV